MKENRSSEKYEFDHVNMARRALKNTALGIYILLLSTLFFMLTSVDVYDFDFFFFWKKGYLAFYDPAGWRVGMQ